MAWAEPDDVPTSVNFLDPAHARKWTDEVSTKKPSRPQFFACIGSALSALGEPRVLELGSGPGHLARAVALHCRLRGYVALDFSDAMHALAREHLGALADRVTFLTRDFRDPAWPDGLGTFDAVITMQAVHETRHKRHHVPLLERARSVLAPAGLLLYCDGYLLETAKSRARARRATDRPRARRLYRGAASARRQRHGALRGSALVRADHGQRHLVGRRLHGVRLERHARFRRGDHDRSARHVEHERDAIHARRRRAAAR